MITVTSDNISDIMTANGGYRKRTLDILGVPHEPGRYPPAGWLRELIGQSFPDDVWEHAKASASAKKKINHKWIIEQPANLFG